MNPLYVQILTRAPTTMGVADPSDPPIPFDVTLYNNFPIPIYLSVQDASGNLTQMTAVDAYKGVTLKTTNGTVYVVQSALTGSFICGVTTADNTPSYVFDYMWLTTPNDIGPLPQPTQEVPIPPNSTRVMIGATSSILTLIGYKIGYYIVREQFWNRQPDSYTLIPGETRTFTSTMTTGLEQVSSHETTIAQSLNLSASAGWGPISASISASLSKNSRDFQQVTVSSQNIAYISDTLTNPYKHQVCLVCRWQLTDIITIFNAAQKPVDSIIMGQSPILSVYTGMNDLQPSPASNRPPQLRAHK